MAGHTVAADARLAGYLAELSAQLHGPRARRRRIVAEIGDGIRDAAQARTERGATSYAALTAALDEFGTPERVAAGFAEELAIGYARLTLAGYVVTGPVVGMWWLLAVWPAHAGLPGAVAAIPVRPLIAAAIVTAIAVAATTGRAIRWLPEAGPRAALACVAAVALVVAGADLTMLAHYAAAVLRAPNTPGMIATVASAVRIAGTARVCVSIESVRRRLPGGVGVGVSRRAGR